MCAPVRPGHDRAKRCGPARQEEQSAEVEHGEQQPADPVGLTFARHDETGAAAVTATDLCARKYAQATTAPSDAVPLARKNSPRKSNTGSSSPPTVPTLARPTRIDTSCKPALVVPMRAPTRRGHHRFWLR